MKRKYAVMACYGNADWYRLESFEDYHEALAAMDRVSSYRAKNGMPDIAIEIVAY